MTSILHLEVPNSLLILKLLLIDSKTQAAATKLLVVKSVTKKGLSKSRLKAATHPMYIIFCRRLTVIHVNPVNRGKFVEVMKVFQTLSPYCTDAQNYINMLFPRDSSIANFYGSYKAAKVLWVKKWTKLIQDRQTMTHDYQRLTLRSFSSAGY